MPQVSLRSLTKVRTQTRWLLWLALWLVADYGLRLWIDAPSFPDRSHVEL